MPTRENPTLRRCSCGATIAYWVEDHAGLIRCYRHGEGEAVLRVTDAQIVGNPLANPRQWIERVHEYEGIPEERQVLSLL